MSETAPGIGESSVQLQKSEPASRKSRAPLAGPAARIAGAALAAGLAFGVSTPDHGGLRPIAAAAAGETPTPTPSPTPPDRATATRQAQLSEQATRIAAEDAKSTQTAGAVAIDTRVAQVTATERTARANATATAIAKVSADKAAESKKGGFPLKTFVASIGAAIYGTYRATAARFKGNWGTGKFGKWVTGR